MDKREFSGALLTDLSKALDCLDLDLLIAKLNTYGSDYKSIKPIWGYLVGRFQRVKVNSKYSSWTKIISGVPQGSILGPLIFDIYLSDLFLFFEQLNIANYADDNTAYACKKDVDAVREKLEEDSSNLIQWAYNNLMAANPDKFHLIFKWNWFFIVSKYW